MTIRILALAALLTSLSGPEHVRVPMARAKAERQEIIEIKTTYGPGIQHWMMG